MIPQVNEALAEALANAKYEQMKEEYEKDCSDLFEACKPAVNYLCAHSHTPQIIIITRDGAKLYNVAMGVEIGVGFGA